MRDIYYFLDYEVKSSRWAGYISNPFLQELVGMYYAWKVKMKYKRYNKILKFRKL